MVRSFVPNRYSNLNRSIWKKSQKIGIFLFDAIFCALRLFVRLCLPKQQQSNDRQNQNSAGLNLFHPPSLDCTEKPEASGAFY